MEEQVNHPRHYNNYSVEVIEMFRRIYGDRKTADWCEMTALKYRMRMGTKKDNPTQQDLDKEQWYLAKAKELRESDDLSVRIELLLERIKENQDEIRELRRQITDLRIRSKNMTTIDIG
jgi:hypothetical protein